MGIADDMKRITENIMDSHEARAKAETARLEDFKSMMGNIQTSLKDLKNYVRGRLGEFHGAHAEMTKQQKKDLAGGETERMEKFKVMMGDIQKDVGRIAPEVEKLLSEFHSEMAKAKAVWQGMAGASASGNGDGELAVAAGAVEKKSHRTGRKKGK